MTRLTLLAILVSGRRYRFAINPQQNFGLGHLLQKTSLCGCLSSSYANGVRAYDVASQLQHVGNGSQSTYTARMIIPLRHEPISVDADRYDLAHLEAFAISIAGKGKEPGTDLGIVVVFSCHVYTERAKHAEEHHMVDHHGKKRCFDRERYEMSHSLPARIRAQIAADALTFISRSFGGNDNLILIEDDEGQTWTIVFCLEPILDSEAGHSGVRMEILSCHAKEVDQKKINRRNISYFARKCIFDERRIPKL